ncbi:hypothetical protein Tco_0999543 [Tanacetum coccineum]
MADKGKKSSMETFAPNDKADYYSGITRITVNGKNAYELKGKFLDDLHNHAFSGTNRKDAAEHIKYYLKIIDLIKLPNVDHDKLRIVVFPISLAGGERRWFDRTKESITCWVDLTAKKFGKYYPPSHIEGNNTPVIRWDPTNPRLEVWLATKFVNYKTMDIFTKGALWDYWVVMKLRNQNQSNILASLSTIKLGVRNGQPIVGERMVIVVEEIFPELTILESRSITKTLNGMRLWKIAN